ncbi:MAG: FapA family protein [Desulfobulbaceae bacterium]|nr:FapA family protein [Desulfobulbaceae bacterium]
MKTPEVERSHPQDELSEDFLSGDVYSADHSADGSYGQVVMHSLASHDPAWYGKEIAIANDKMRVTVKINGGKPLSSYQLNHGLEQLGVSYGVIWQAVVDAETLSQNGQRGEIVVARGTPAEAKRNVTFPDVQRGVALDGSFFWLVDGVKLDAKGLRTLFAAESLDKVDKNTLLTKAVSPGTILARVYQNPEAQSGKNVMDDIIDPVDDILPELGENTWHNEKDGTYEATAYGYLALEDNVMSVVLPIWIQPDHLGAYYLNCTQLGDPVYPTASDLLNALMDMHIDKSVVRQGLIDKLAKCLQQGQQLTAKTVKVAEAIAPKPGRNASFELCEELGGKGRKIRNDGTIDLRERNAVVAIKAGTLIAEKTTATKGVNGANLLGETIAAADGVEQNMLFADVIRVEERDGKIYYYAQKDGNLRFSQNTLTIADIYTVSHNVDSITGNIDRSEDIQINGSVMAGFTVRSQGNISIAGSVYNGAKVFAGGDVTVGEGIIGTETRVVALGNLQAIFIHEAEVIVKGDALVSSYLYNAVLRANGTITVVINNQQGYGHRSGRIIGGLTCSSKGIEVSRVGRPGQAVTVLAILPDPEFSGQMRRLEDEDKNCRESIARIARTLPFENFDSAAIKRGLAQIPAEKRDPVIKLLTTFNSLIKRQQNIEALRKEVNSRMLNSLRNGTIVIQQEICQGSEVQFGDKKLVISVDTAGTTFTLQGGEIV